MPIQTEKGIFKPIIYVGAVSDQRLLIIRYKTPPNPEKQGWWLPAPEIEFGADPSDEAAALVKEVGLTLNHMSLVGIDSFVANGAWHFMAKFRAEVTGAVHHDNVEETRWITEQNMPPASDFAHGAWEVDLCRFFLNSRRLTTA